MFVVYVCLDVFISGNNGLYDIMQVISKLLDPKTSEHTASFVGRLVSIVITKVGQQLWENLDLMLRLVLSKMQQAETLSVMEVEGCGPLVENVSRDGWGGGYYRIYAFEDCLA